MMRAKSNRIIVTAFSYLMMTLLALIIMIPLFWMLSTSLKGRWDIFTWPPQWIPETFHWENYKEAFTLYPLGRFMLNTAFLAVVNVLFGLFTVPLVAYGFARLRFPGKNTLFLIVLGTMMIPVYVKLIPLYTIYLKLGLLDTYWPLIFAYLFGRPFFIFLLVQYMKTMPRDLDEAARIDGVGTWGILYRIILPLCKPALTIIIVYTFLWTWNEFMQPLIFLNTFEKFTIQLGLSFFKGRYGVQWNLFMAATLVTILPILVIYFFVQKQLIGGIASLGLKG